MVNSPNPQEDNIHPACNRPSSPPSLDDTEVLNQEREIRNRLRTEATEFLTKIPAHLERQGTVTPPDQEPPGSYTALIQATDQSRTFLTFAMKDASSNRGELDVTRAAHYLKALIRTWPAFSAYKRDPVLHDMKRIGKLCWALNDHVLVRRGAGEEGGPREVDVADLTKRELRPLIDTLAPGLLDIREAAEHLELVAKSLLTLPPGKDRLEAYLEWTETPWETPTGSKVLAYRLPYCVADPTVEKSLAPVRSTLQRCEPLPQEEALFEMLGLPRGGDPAIQRERASSFSAKFVHSTEVPLQDRARSPFLRLWDLRGSTQWVLMSREELIEDYREKRGSKHSSEADLDKASETYARKRLGSKVHPGRAHILFTLAFGVNLCTAVESQRNGNFLTGNAGSRDSIGSALVRGGDGEVALDFTRLQKNLDGFEEIAREVLQGFQLLVEDISQHPYFFVNGKLMEGLSMRAIAMNLREQGSSQVYRVNNPLGGITTGVLAAGSYALSELQRIVERGTAASGYEGVIPEDYFCTPPADKTLEYYLTKYPSIKKIYRDLREALDRGDPKSFSLWSDEKFSVPFNGYGGILSISSVIGNTPFRRLWDSFKEIPQVKVLAARETLTPQLLKSYAEQTLQIRDPKILNDDEKLRDTLLQALVERRIRLTDFPHGDMVKLGDRLISKTTQENFRQLRPQEVECLAEIIRTIWPGFHWEVERTRGTQVLNYFRRLIGSVPEASLELKESEVQPHTNGGLLSVLESERVMRCTWCSQPGFQDPQDRSWNYNSDIVVMNIQALKHALNKYAEARGYLIEFGAAGLPVTRDNLTVRYLSPYACEFLGLPPDKKIFVQLFPRDDILYEAATNMKREISKRSPQERALFFMREISHEVSLAGRAFSDRFSRMVYSLWIHSKKFVKD